MNPRLRAIAQVGVVVLLLAGSVWLGMLMVHNHVTHPDPTEAPGARFAPNSVPATTLDGTPQAIVISGRQRPLLMLLLRVDCPFCQRNMPNWVALAERLDAMGEEAPEVLALSVSSAEETRAYLEQHGLDVPVRLVHDSVLPDLGSSGYPTTIAVVPANMKLIPWSGVLGDEQQEAILQWAADPEGDADAMPIVGVAGAAAGDATPAASELPDDPECCTGPELELTEPQPNAADGKASGSDS